MGTPTIIVLLVLGVVYFGTIARRILFIANDKNFQSNSKWPEWMRSDVSKYNATHPDKKVSIK